MFKIVFKNLQKSKLVQDITTERLQMIVEKFPDLKNHLIKVNISMENSPVQAGPDLFTLKLNISGTKYKSIILKKSAQSFYIALADIVEHTLEKLNRYGDRLRLNKVKEGRNFNTYNINDNGGELI